MESGRSRDTSSSSTLHGKDDQIKEVNQQAKEFLVSERKEADEKEILFLNVQFENIQLLANRNSDEKCFSPQSDRAKAFKMSSADSLKSNRGKEPAKITEPNSPAFSYPEEDNSPSQPVGQLALHCLIDEDLPLPAVRSFITRNERRTHQDAEFIAEYYPSSYAPEDSVIGQLRFALSHEACDLTIICAALRFLGPDRLTEWVKREPGNAESRRAWFFYETLTGETLSLENVTQGEFVDALLEKYHYVAVPRDSPRHRVRDNLLGTRSLCPTLRKTPKLEAMRALRLDEEIRRLSNQYPPEILMRAVNSLMTNETRDSFKLEGEVHSLTETIRLESEVHSSREDCFLRALHSLSDFNPRDKSAFTKLQNIIVQSKFAAEDWRETQIYIGRTTRRDKEEVSFICPRPEDVPDLMDGWIKLTDRLLHQDGGTIDAVMAAAVSAFAFVFIHPFEDGNGRIHRFLMQYILQKWKFTLPHIFLPISTSILREKNLYEAALEVFSKPVMSRTKWHWNCTGNAKSIVVENDTRNLFRFFDATTQAEYLYGRIENAIHHDLKLELDYLAFHDAAVPVVQQIANLSVKQASRLVLHLFQNKGRLSNKKKRLFRELDENIISQVEAAVVPLLQPK